MLKETLFALIVVFNQSPTQWQEVSYYEGLTFEQCDNAQRAIWAQDWFIVGYDEDLWPLPEVDAYCLPVERLSEAEFLHVVR